MTGVTISDIAAATGTSPSTVSRALSDPDKVNARTRDKIQKVAEEMGYVPNRIARSLSLGRTGTIGLIVPDIANPFFPPIIKAVQARAGRKDNAVLLADTDENAADELDRAKAMAKQVDGIILVSPRGKESQLEQIIALGPTVVVNRRVDGVSCVVTENTDGIDQAVEHLVALGHTTIAYLAGPRRSWSNRQRQAAIENACKVNNVQLVEYGPFEPQIQAGVQAADLLQASNATAAIAYDDLIALGAMARLTEHGHRPGVDMSIIGIDDSPMSHLAYPTLTTIHIPGTEAGTAAVDLLQTVISNPDTDPTVIELETRLIIRASTGPVSKK